MCILTFFFLEMTILLSVQFSCHRRIKKKKKEYGFQVKCRPSLLIKRKQPAKSPQKQISNLREEGVGSTRGWGRNRQPILQGSRTSTWRSHLGSLPRRGREHGKSQGRGDPMWADTWWCDVSAESGDFWVGEPQRAAVIWGLLELWWFALSMASRCWVQFSEYAKQTNRKWLKIC